MKDTWKTIVGGILISLFSLSVGFCISQIGIVSEVKTNSTEIGHLKQAQNQIYTEFSKEKDRADIRMETVSSLIKAMINQNQDFINLLKVQNELLTRKSGGITP